MDTGLTEIDLAQFTGRGLDRYADPFVVEALAQAGDLLELATRISDLPSADTLLGRMARRGVLAMAESLFEGNTFRDLRFTPFKSETIGSYTYSLAEGQISQGIPTGVAWFDLAVSRLLDEFDTSAGIVNASISVFDRPGDVEMIEGQASLIGPADTEHFSQGYRYGGSGAQPR